MVVQSSCVDLRALKLPRAVEEAHARHALPQRGELGRRHEEGAVVASGVPQGLLGLVGHLLRAIGPRATPLATPPWVADLEELRALVLGDREQ